LEEVYGHISVKKPQAYDVATTILQNLYMLAKYQDNQDEYEQHIRKILQEYSRLPLQRLAHQLFAKIQSRTILPVIEAFPLSRAAEAHHRIESRRTMGAVVLTPGG
jgi:NADPH:quinone reductase-like Zn-dependent oxidoreductase